VTRKAIVGGTGYDEPLGGKEFTRQEACTPFGDAVVYLGHGPLDDLVFIPRHGTRHSIPPHRINYRANLMALFQLGVERVVALSAVGGLKRSVPPGAIVLVDQLIDWTHGRQETFFDGGEWGVAHTDVTDPYCNDLRTALLTLGELQDIGIQPHGVYMAVSGPRLETAAEIQMYASLGGTVVGMTGAPEAALARELGIHYSLVCTSINYAAGLDGRTVRFDSADQAASLESLLDLAIAALRVQPLGQCSCAESTQILFQPGAWNPHRDLQQSRESVAPGGVAGEPRVASPHPEDNSRENQSENMR